MEMVGNTAALRDQGIRIAERHAAAVVPHWPGLAMAYLYAAIGNPPIDIYTDTLTRFQTTDFRKWAENRVKVQSASRPVTYDCA